MILNESIAIYPLASLKASNRALSAQEIADQYNSLK